MRIRLVIAISLDGRIAFDHNEATNLGEEGDRKVLEESLSWCDATIMGGNTLKAHKSTCLIHNKELIEDRLNKGKGSQPICIIASNSNDQELEWAFFKQPITKWLISSKSSNLKIIPYYQFHIQSQENWLRTIELIASLKIDKIVLLGGAKIIESFLMEDLIDEIQITLTPKIIGGNFSWVPLNKRLMINELSKNNAWKITKTRKLNNNEIMLFYTRNR